MVAISLSGSGEGLGRAIARGYSTGNDGIDPGVVIPAEAGIHAAVTKDERAGAATASNFLARQRGQVP